MKTHVFIPAPIGAIPARTICAPGSAARIAAVDAPNSFAYPGGEIRVAQNSRKFGSFQICQRRIGSRYPAPFQRLPPGPYRATRRRKNPLHASQEPGASMAAALRYRSARPASHRRTGITRIPMFRRRGDFRVHFREVELAFARFAVRPIDRHAERFHRSLHPLQVDGAGPRLRHNPEEARRKRGRRRSRRSAPRPSERNDQTDQSPPAAHRYLWRR